MEIDYISIALISIVIIFSTIAFIVIRQRSTKSSHPDAQKANDQEPTPLNHAPPGSHNEFMASMYSLSLKKPGTPDIGSGLASGTTLGIGNENSGGVKAQE